MCQKKECVEKRKLRLAAIKKAQITNNVIEGDEIIVNGKKFIVKKLY